MKKAPPAMSDLLQDLPRPGGRERLGDGAALLRGFARPDAAELLAGVNVVLATAPFRRMMTLGGHLMSVAMTNCGTHGWITDRSGYRYDQIDPLTVHPWPPMPDVLRRVAVQAAAEAGYPGFAPDACLINRYEPGTRLSLHQDRNERDLASPIVSVSLGLPATFLFGGSHRNERPRRISLESGDIVVWGGPTRLAFHGVDPVADGEHRLTDRCRINLTFRRAR
jgi:alkylated DNA repair protein (DNA oxidative demethylase)